MILHVSVNSYVIDLFHAQQRKENRRGLNSAIHLDANPGNIDVFAVHSYRVLDCNCFHITWRRRTRLTHDGT